MGITGLLPLLKESIDQTHISKFRNQRLAVDGYCWLHRALYGSTLSDMTGKSLNESTRWIQYCMGILDMLLSYEIEVYLVFDGKNLPAKERTEADRAASRSKNLELGYEEKRKGNKAEARSLLARSVDVSPRMAAQFMQVLRKHRPQVKFVVAPYEADAQLSFLCANDLVDGVISEDSDCVPYGCKSILFKLDKQSGQCSHLSLATLKTHSTKGFDLQKFDSQMMVTMCVAAGCDYAASPKNFGLKTSHRLVSKLRTPGRLLKSMKFDGVMPLVVATEASSADCVVYEYELEFYRAFMTFHHQTVFDPVSRVMKPLQPFERRTHNALYPAYMHLPDGSERSTSELFPFLGHIVKESSLAIGIAEGLVDPNTLQPFNLPEPLEDSRPLQRRHSDISGSRCTLAQKGSQQHKRQNSPVTSASSTIKRRRSTGSGTLARQGVFVNEPPTSNSTTKLRLNGDGSLGQIKTSAPKITSFFKSGAPSINKLVVPEMSSRKASISNYFTSKKAPINIPVRETLKKINENTSERAAERLQRTAGLSDSPQTFKSDKQQQFDNLSMLSSQNSSTSTVSTASTPPSFSYDDSLSPPLSGPTKREVTYTRDNPLDIREFAYDNNASKGIANRAGVLVEHNENIIVDLVEDSDSNVSVEFVSTTGGGFPSANNVTSLHGRRPVGGAGSMVEQKEVRSKGNTNSVKRTSLQCGEQKENNVFSMFKFKASNAPTTLAISKRR